MELKINSFIGSMNEDIDITKEGKDILIGFNPKFFIDALRVIDEEEVSLYMVNPKAPCFIKDDDGKFFYLSILNKKLCIYSGFYKTCFFQSLSQFNKFIRLSDIYCDHLSAFLS